MSEAFTDADYERVVRERDEALARVDSQRSQIAFYRTACTARFLPEGFGDETMRELINDLMEDRDDARSTIEDLNDEIARGREAIRIYRTETEAAKRERDEARREADRFRHGCTVESDFVCPNEYAVSELTAERNFLRALKKNHEEDFARVCKERDEARAERDSAKLSAAAASLAHDSIEKMVRFELRVGTEESLHTALQRVRYERDEARAEVEHAYREGGALYEAKIAEREAYRSGAEAMREAVDKVVCTKGIWDSSRLSARIEALPIPEEL